MYVWLFLCIQESRCHFYATLIFINYTLPSRKESQVPGQVKSAKVPGQVNMLVLVRRVFEISPGTYSSLVDKE